MIARGLRNLALVAIGLAAATALGALLIGSAAGMSAQRALSGGFLLVGSIIFTAGALAGIRDPARASRRERLMRGGGSEGISFTSFAPATVFVPGLGAALVFVIGSFMGFEATAIFAEEAENPERTIPRATYAAVALIAGFYAFSTWAITQYYGPAAAQATAQAAWRPSSSPPQPTCSGPGR